MHALRKINRKKREWFWVEIHFKWVEIQTMCFPLAVPSSVRERRKRPLFCYVINFVENEIVLFLQSGFEFLVGFLSFLRFQLWCVDFIMMFSLCARKRIKKQNSSCNEKTKKGWKIFCAHSFTIFISTFFVCFSLHESLIFVDLFSTPRPAIASLKLKHLSAVWETTHTHREYQYQCSKQWEVITKNSRFLCFHENTAESNRKPN